MKIHQPHTARQIVGRSLHGQCDGTRKQDADIDKVIQTFQQGGGVREEVDFIQKEPPELVMLVQFPDKPPGIIILVEGVRRQVKRIVVLKRVLSEQNGLAGPAGAHDSGEMFACVTHQYWEQKALTVVLAALLLCQVMKLQQSIDTHKK
jgi:hypothetical protein